MRLINVTTLSLEEFYDDEVPPYAILSHRWQGEEVLFRHMENGTASTKKGFRKLQMACKQTASDGISYIWIDTCCIDKSSSAELSEAINSMYRYYQEAHKCYAYLYDVDLDHMPAGEIKIEHSIWFTRAWTLQELLAPTNLIFYDCEWRNLQTKRGMAFTLAEITGIPIHALSREFRPNSHSIAQRMSWAAHRNATRKEDLAYSLFGIFGVNMPMLYGEGNKAFLRLQEEIIKRSADQSILAWVAAPNSDLLDGRLLASSPAEFRDCGNVFPTYIGRESFAFDNIGLNIELPIIPWKKYHDYHLALLNCRSNHHCFIGIFLKYLKDGKTYERVLDVVDFPGGRFELQHDEKPEILRLIHERQRKRITICQFGGLQSSNEMYSFMIYVNLRRMKKDRGSGEDLRIWYMESKDSMASSQKMSWHSDVSFHWFTLQSSRDTFGTSGLFMFPWKDPKRIVRVKLGFDFSSNPVCCVQLSHRITKLDEVRATEVLNDFDSAWIYGKSHFAPEASRWGVFEGLKKEWIFTTNDSKAISASIREIGLSISIMKLDRWDVVIEELNSLNEIVQRCQPNRD